MKLEDLEAKLGIDPNMGEEDKLALVKEIQANIPALRAEQRVLEAKTQANLVVEAIKKIKEGLEARFDELNGIVDVKVRDITSGKDGIDGKDGKDGVNGKDGRDGISITGPKGADGADGEDGVGVQDAHIDFDGSLIITLTTGKELNVGEVVPMDVAEKIKIISNGGGTSQSVLDSIASLQSQIDILIPSQTGNSGKYLTTNGTTTSWATVATGSGTVTSVGGTGTVNGLSLSGTVTSSGNLTFGGTLDLSSPPAIGGTAAAAGKFTTLESTGTASLGTGSTTYVRAIGDASYPGIYVTGGTNTPLVLQPLGTGALQAQKTDSTATGGNARGANAVDWQTSRNAANNVATGQYSVIGGGNNNRAPQYASVVAGGENNLVTLSAYTSILGGSLNSVSGPFSSIAGGASNTAAGIFNFIGAGYTNSGTANAAVTTQSATMNGTTAVTLAATNANIKVGQYITGTSIAGDTYVAAISGTSLTLSKNASGSSTSTLSFYTPHGVVVGGGNNQATGAYSFIGGGGDAGTAANRNVASADWSVVTGGIANQATGIAAFIGGGGFYLGNPNGNSASGLFSSCVGGIGNQTAGQGSFVGSGYTNKASGNYSSAFGYTADARSIDSAVIFSSRNSASTGGGSQAGIYVLSVNTIDATPAVLKSNSGAAGSTNQVILPNNSAYYFRGEVIAGVTGGGNTKGWYIEGVIKRGSGVSTAALVGTPTVMSSYADVGAATWTIAVTADTTNGGLAVTFTGQASTTIRCVAQIRTTEMTY